GGPPARRAKRAATSRVWAHAPRAPAGGTPAVPEAPAGGPPALPECDCAGFDGAVGQRMPSGADARWWTVFALLFLLGAGLRLYHLGHRSLSTDEANVFWMARGTFGEIVLQNAIGNSAPPLYALALNPLAEAHASEAALRSLSCAAAIAGLVALAALARAYSGPTGALFALFIAAIAPSQVFYAQFLREYSLAFLVAALLLLAFTHFQRHPTGWNWGALTLLVVLSIFVQ